VLGKFGKVDCDNVSFLVASYGCGKGCCVDSVRTPSARGEGVLRGKCISQSHSEKPHLTIERTNPRLEGSKLIRWKAFVGVGVGCEFRKKREVKGALKLVKTTGESRPKLTIVKSDLRSAAQRFDAVVNRNNYAAVKVALGIPREPGV